MATAMLTVPAVLKGQPAGARSETASAQAKTQGLLKKLGDLLEAVSRKRMSAHERADAILAVKLIWDKLTDLQSCIVKHEKPPAYLSQKQALIKVEKARKEVLAAVKECSGRASPDCQKLFDEVELFIELRPNEPVTPRNFNLKWNSATPQELPRRDIARVHTDKGARDSLVASIVGLADIAEGRDWETPTDAAGPAFAPPSPPAQLKVKQQPQAQQPAPRLSKDAGSRPLEASLLGSAAAVVAATTAAAAAAPGANTCSTSGVCAPPSPQSSRNTPLAPACQFAKDAPLLEIQRSENENEPRPTLSAGVADSSASMCNMDSCATGPHRGGHASAMAAAGCFEEEDDDDEDEVSSADNGRYGSTDGGRYGSSAAASHERVVLLQKHPLPQQQQAQPLMQLQSGSGPLPSLSARSSAAAPLQPLPPPQLMRVLGSSAEITAGAPVGMGGSGAAAAVPAAASPAATQQPSAMVLEAALRSQESIMGNRSYMGKEPRQFPSGPTTATVLLQQRAASTDLPLAPPPSSAATMQQQHQQHGMLSEMDALRLRAAAQQVHLPTRYVITRHHHANPAAAAPTGPHQQQLLVHLPVAMVGQAIANPHAAAGMAAVAQPYGSHAHSHHSYHPAAYGNGPYGSLPPSGPSSLRDFPMGPAAGPIAAAVHPSRPGVSHHQQQLLQQGSGPSADSGGPRYGSQPPSGHQSMDSSQAGQGHGSGGPYVPHHPYHNPHQAYYHPSYPASAAGWDTVSLADTEPLPGASGRRDGRRNGRRRGGGLFGFVKGVVGFVGVSVLSGAAMVLGAAAVNTSLDEQEAAQQARGGRPPVGGASGNRRGQRLGRGGDDLIPQRTLQQLRSPDLLALGRG